MITEIIICLIVGYAFGCISTGYLVGKYYNVNLKEHGSGNSGSTNALRTLGKKAGIITLIGDVSKAVIPILILKYLLKDSELSSNLIILYTGLGAICGHIFPFWMGFNGGKGIACLGGLLLVLNFPKAMLLFAIFLSITAITKYVSLGSIIAAACVPIVVGITYRNDKDCLHMVVICCIYTCLAVYKHRANIKRLLSGTENKLGSKTK